MNPAMIQGSSALNAYGDSLQVTARNTANLINSAATAAEVNFRDRRGGGVSAVVVERGDTVDISREALRLQSDRSGSRAAVKVMKTADEMTRELFSIKA